MSTGAPMPERNPAGTTPSKARRRAQREANTGLEAISSAAAQARGMAPNESIASRAFELFLERGGAHGNDVDDWLRAERELKAPRES
jgi:hypothetical protein